MTQEANKMVGVQKNTASSPQKEPTETTGSVTKFLFNVHGDSDGFILDGEKQIHFPPHLSAEVLKSVKTGDKIRVQGHKLAVGLTIAGSMTLPGGTKIVDNGPPAKHLKN